MFGWGGRRLRKIATVGGVGLAAVALAACEVEVEPNNNWNDAGHRANATHIWDGTGTFEGAGGLNDGTNDFWFIHDGSTNLPPGRYTVGVGLPAGSGGIRVDRIDLGGQVEFQFDCVGQTQTCWRYVDFQINPGDLLDYFLLSVTSNGHAGGYLLGIVKTG